MPPFFPKPPSIPIPQSLFICSTFTLNKSLKNYPKHFKCLKIETKVSNSIDSQILSKSRLKALQRRAKSLKVLDLERYQQLEASQALTFLKSCNHISSLILFDDFYRYVVSSYKSSIEGLIQLQCTYIAFGYLPFSYQSNEVHRSQNPSLLKTLQVKNLQKAKKCCKHPLLNLQSLKDLFSHLISLSRLHKPSISPKCLLTRYDLNLFLSFSHLLEWLHFLRSPHKISHFTAYVPDVFDPNDRSPQKLIESLTRFQSLYALNLGINTILPISTLFKPFKTLSNLHELRLYIPIQKKKQLIELAEVLGDLRNLSLFAIVNTKAIQSYASKGHRIFFNQISGMTKLKSLKINLYGESADSLASEIFYGCLGEFAGCVGKLHELEEIKFTQSELGIAPEFDSLADVLKKKGSRLKKLKIKFVNGQKKIDHLKKLNKAFKTMGNLEELSLKGLSTEKENLIQFIEVISELKWIKSVKLHGINPGLEKADLMRTLKKILMKNGLENLKWFGNQPIRETNNNDVEEGDFIDFKEVILRNPRLHSVRLDFLRVENEDLVFKNVKGFLP